MTIVLKKDTIIPILVAIMCFLALVSPVSGIGCHLDLIHYQPSLQDDTVFGNYTTDNTMTYYNTCTPEVQIEVYDPDGIDSVWLTYRRMNESSILNETMDVLSLGDRNTYIAYFTVNVYQTYNNFVVQFHANDSLGHQTSSNEYSLVVVYNPPDPPANGNYGLQLIIGLSISSIVAVGFFLAWKKGLVGKDE